MDSYFTVATALTKEYVAKNFHKDIEQNVDTPQFVKWSAGPYTITISEISLQSTLVNIIKGKDTKSVMISWQEWDVSLPLDKISQDLQSRFQAFMDSHLFPLPKQHAQSEKPQSRLQEETPSAGLQMPLPGIRSSHARPNDMPDFDDEYEMLSRPNHASSSGDGLPSIGDRDLNPPGLPRDPLMKPYLDPLAHPDSGMHPTRDHPLFGRTDPNTSRAGVPPGARFDDPFGESNLDDMGQGLPGNMRRGGGRRAPDIGGGFGGGFDGGLGGGFGSFGGGFM